jgi:HaeII restriction endonuclease
MMWYERALRGKYGDEIAPILLTSLQEEILVEFPVTEKEDFDKFYTERGYFQFISEFSNP